MTSPMMAEGGWTSTVKLSKEIYFTNQHCTMLVRLNQATLGFMCSSVSPVVVRPSSAP